MSRTSPGLAAPASVVIGPPVRTRSRRHRPLRSPLAYLFVAPALLVFLAFTILPTLFTFVISTFKWNYLNMAKSRFIGADNYVAMLDNERDPSFGATMLISLYFVGVMVVVGTALALALALLVSRPGRLTTAVRSAMFLAYVAPLVATSLVWLWIYNGRFGLANVILNGLHLPTFNWTQDSRVAMVAIIVYSLWHELGFTTIIFVGGLTTLSQDLSEAAKLDGAGAWQEFVNVTLPQLRPYVVFVIVIGSVSSLHAFTQFFVLTGGGPGYATSTLGFQLYQQAFIIRNTGYAAALAVVLFVITIVLSIAQLYASRSVGRDT